jgi:hypothetical protein
MIKREGEEVLQEVTGNSQERVDTSSISSSRARDKSRQVLLFPSKNKHQLFMTAFHCIIRDNVEEFTKLGVEPVDLGLHLAYKGPYIYASAGCTISPPMASIFLRACWSVGPVKEGYLNYEKVRDQFLGCAVSGLNMTETDLYKELKWKDEELSCQ